MKFPKIILVKSLGVPVDSIEELEEILERWGESNYDPIQISSKLTSIRQEKKVL